MSKPTHEEKTVPFVLCFGTQDLSHTKRIKKHSQVFIAYGFSWHKGMKAELGQPNRILSDEKVVIKSHLYCRGRGN